MVGMEVEAEEGWLGAEDGGTGKVHVITIMEGIEVGL